MKDSDVAQDAIAFVGLESPKTLAAVKAGKKDVRDLLLRLCGKEYYRDDSQVILGVAECLLDHGVDLGPVMGIVEKAVSRELAPAELGTWVNPDKREAALRRFRDRLRGKKRARPPRR